MLLSLLVEDSNGVGRPVAFAVVSSNDRTHVERFLNFFSENNSVETTRVVVTDRVVAAANVVRECWPNVQPMICHFHILSSLGRFVRSCELSTDDRKQCAKVKNTSRLVVVFVTLRSFSQLLAVFFVTFSHAVIICCDGYLVVFLCKYCQKTSVDTFLAAP